MATFISIRVLEQTFIIRYTDVVSGVVMDKSGIEEKVVGIGDR